MEAPAPHHRFAIARLCLGGFLALVVAMGIGRFAFTPLLPLMQAAGQIDLAHGAWLASANYLGYFAGAWSVARLPLAPQVLVRGGVVLVAALTAAMAATGQLGAWLLLRFAAGVLSAWVLVGVSAWCLPQLAAAGRSGLGGVVYAGVGTGIALAGLGSLAGAAQPGAATALWWQLGLGAAVLGGVVWWLVPAGRRSAGAQASSTQAAAVAGERALVLCYGCFGFGYILPATFLPALARTVFEDAALFGWAWPVFGTAAAASTWLAGRWFSAMPRTVLWRRSQYFMALGTALPGAWPCAATVLISALLVGGTFMVATMAGLQEARARAGTQATRLLGRMTAAFALGQIAGPVCSALLALGFGGRSGADLGGIRTALLLAGIVLAASAWRLLKTGTESPESIQGVSR